MPPQDPPLPGWMQGSPAVQTLARTLLKPRHNYRYVCAELIRLYSRGQELLSYI